MPYTISERGGRYFVTSPKGKTWKTTYPSQAAAEKGVAYVESRFSGGSSKVPVPQVEESPDTAAERKALGIPPRPAPEEEDTGGY